MKLVLTKNAHNQVAVACDGQPSHTFPLSNLFARQGLALADPVAFGARLFEALFAAGGAGCPS